ncbi:hypothetical protein [Gulosibacter molinativorax]|uniref:Antitoxin of toxin-antitoxin stability system n=1 Tax=Gulosibacter molinativorax TaxID=256821 RepID=A0ABT7C7A5_9MICO|nr:hypothetical protein [Gulosibacter molinativorax]MDJ1370993.1 antitoxin of toxin-antitoxin stability system [Gulosibacter molinativorax]QUY62785.1 Prevent host death protein, Phd antitoxin [Gulosibacter molinativorax]
MTKDAVFTLKLESELRDEFLAAAAAAQRPASQVARELMREYVQSQNQQREYQEFLAEKTRSARESLQAGDGVDNAEVEGRFAERRTPRT